MISNDNDFEPSVNASIFPDELRIAILKLTIPKRIHLRSAREFDDKSINNTTHKWSFDYSGSRRYLVFKGDDISVTFLKYICFKYVSMRCATFVSSILYDWQNLLVQCQSIGEFSLEFIRSVLEGESIDGRSFYSILFGLKIICAEEFPGFTLDDYEDLEFIPRPHLHNWDMYQEIDNILEPLEKSMISNGLFEMGNAITRRKHYSLTDVRNSAVLGLSYVTGARPVQLAKLAAGDLYIDTCNPNTGLTRYSILLPYVKQRRVTTERLLLAIPPEIGVLIKHYIDRARLLPADKMFEMGASAPRFVSQAINKTILNFSPPDYQSAVACGEAAPPSITSTDLRHNVGHSLAMQGASAEEIAHILGHSSLVVAKHYILATPALALIRAKALGSNPVWQNMVSMMLTGKLVPSKEWEGRRVVGMLVEGFDKSPIQIGFDERKLEAPGEKIP
ncbi:site-specific integrase [Salmonella enterica]|nr:site-specific integrase [Salmonella enterica]